MEFSFPKGTPLFPKLRTTAGQLLHIPHRFQLQAYNMVSLVMFFLIARVGRVSLRICLFVRATVIVPLSCGGASIGGI
jgi:hypothetical protein